MEPNKMYYYLEILTKILGKLRQTLKNVYCVAPFAQGSKTKIQAMLSEFEY